MPRPRKDAPPKPQPQPKPKALPAGIDPVSAEQKLASTSKERALQWLTTARNLLGDNTIRIAIFEDARQRGRYTYEQLGTNVAEVKALIAFGFKVEAETVLSHLRNCPMPQHTVHRINWLNRHLERAGMTYADIGTTPAEVEAFRTALPAPAAA